MKEILFRGKRVDNGEWVEGYYEFGYAYNYNEDEEIPYHRIIAFDNVKRINELVFVCEETVGQFIGLTDKNGTKIFEGDIVRYGDTVHEVVFEQRNSTAYFGLVYNSLETRPFGHYQDLRQIEVIGNIHDNPELLK